MPDPMPLDLPPCSLTPLYDHLIVLRDTAASMSGQIFIPDGAKEEPFTGLVLSTGEGRLCPSLRGRRVEKVQNPEDGTVTPMLVDYGVHIEPLRVKRGDRILFQSYSFSEVMDPISHQKVLVMNEDAVLAILPTVTPPASEQDHSVQ